MAKMQNEPDIESFFSYDNDSETYSVALISEEDGQVFKIRWDKAGVLDHYRNLRTFLMGAKVLKEDER